MRVNIYAEEMTDRIEIIEKVIEGQNFTAVRFYLELPVTKEVTEDTHAGPTRRTVQVQGPFIHRPGDDDSAAVTFWGKKDLRVLLGKALELLNDHYDKSTKEAED